MYTTVIDFPIFSVFPFKEEFKCHSCRADSTATGEKKEEVCKEKHPICMTTTGREYRLHCADMEYYNVAEKYCETIVRLLTVPSHCVIDINQGPWQALLVDLMFFITRLLAASDCQRHL